MTMSGWIKLTLDYERSGQRGDIWVRLAAIEMVEGLPPSGSVVYLRNYKQLVLDSPGWIMERMRSADSETDEMREKHAEILRNFPELRSV